MAWLTLGIAALSGDTFGNSSLLWQAVGWTGNACFFSRFLVQWYATEKKQQVVVPVAFWWLSLAGSLCILSYAIMHKPDAVFICANAFNWIPYLRNLVIHRRQHRSLLECVECGQPNGPRANYCSECGTPVAKPTPD